MIVMQTKQLLQKRIWFFSYIININENLKRNEKNVVLSTRNWATYLDQTQTIM